MSHAPSMTGMSASRHALHLELATETLRRFSQVRFVAQGTSMLPTLYPGDCLTAKSFGAAIPRRGEIVLCRRGNEFRVHRIVRISNEGPHTMYVLRGDALIEDDPAISACELLGRVTSIERRGKRLELNAAEKGHRRVLRLIVQRSKIVAAFLGHWHALLAGLPPPARPFVAASAKGKIQCS